MRTHNPGRVIAVAGAALLSVALIGGAGYAFADLATGTSTRTEHHTYDGVADLTISVSSGNVDIIGDSGSDVTVDVSITETLRKANTSTTLDGDTLTLSGDCPPLSGSRCAVSFTVRVPDGTAVDAHSHSGDITAIGLTGSAVLASDSGSVMAHDTAGPLQLSTHSGDVRAVQARGGPISLTTRSGDVNAADITVEGALRMQTSSGDVSAVGVHAPSATGKTNSGDVRLVFRSAPQQVEANTHSGDVSVLVPSGSYNVDVHTNSGDSHVGVSRDSASPNQIVASTRSGDVRVEYSS